MANIPQDLLYSPEHEYLKPAGEDNVYYVGVTDFAQGELGDIVFVELPKAGEQFDRMAVFGTVEAVKAVSELFAPVSGEIVEVNAALDANPALINSDPYGEGWMIKMRITDSAELDGLMDATAYEEHIG
jgi:glycine cleavage system H protein